ncbi:sigma-54-dependent Fis family transcriptional regulator [Alloacidobacterium dinghuense]|uniref:Sigma-54-dependent Fis family transcriptional regulator n=1 Tax=Alloacidobacterium dinghuense TaxID=2763107 RepID=A0A7G8BNP9_9BACT|nr:sigma-54 dependent transcriptional regulator [Alloacidobacterium dinghuense]QNI34169.1 sigma-54-dependent Fis family transcriptional regulator [Alloacidobacterium dinghuense]
MATFTPVMKRESATSARTAVIASADLSFRQRVKETLTGLHWRVREAAGGAEAIAHLDSAPAEAVILDSWLPDLEVQEFVAEFEKLYPLVDLIAVDGSVATKTARSPRRNEILYALRRGQDEDGAIWNSAPVIEWPEESSRGGAATAAPSTEKAESAHRGVDAATNAEIPAGRRTLADPSCRLPEFIGNHPAMLEVSRRIRLVAQHRTAVLVQGPTGTGKELVARALHRLSARSSRPFVALNCAAIPEALLEAELFGHTRGAFTGAVQGRVGRIEAAQGGTLFLDEIGEMPLPLQAKLLRFVECGELQRVGDNEPVLVDVRIVAATHRSLAKLAAEGTFRADLYYRLAVFLIRTPDLQSHKEDLSVLVQHFLGAMAETSPAKAITAAAMQKLEAYSWPGNVRELEHMLERAWILAESRPEISAEEIEFGEQAGDF